MIRKEKTLKMIRKSVKHKKSGESLRADKKISQLKKQLNTSKQSIQKTEQSLKKLHKELDLKNKELQKLDSLKTEFISTVSHELRTPMTIIRESVAQMHEGIVGEINPQQKEYLSMSLENIDRLGRIINDLLDISKIEAGKIELYKSEIDIAELANATCGQFRPRARQKGVQLKTVFPAGKVLTYADYDKLVQVFTNLIGNAVKFTDKGIITVTVDAGTEDILCKVEDTGRGITTEDMPKVFGKFEQFGREHGPGEKGTGLGLAICKNIVRMHGGEIWAQSQWTKGSKFGFNLPQVTSKEFFWETLGKSIGAAIRDGSYTSLIIFAVRFDAKSKSKVNKEIQEKAITEVLEFIRKNLRRKADSAIRYGDEIRVILPSASREDADMIALRMRSLVHDHIEKEPWGSEVTVMCEVSGFPKDASTAEGVVQEAEARVRRTKKILIVDDEPDCVQLIQRYFDRHDYETDTASSGREAISKIKSRTPDLIILDVQMPDMSGYEVVGRLKEEKTTRHIPVIIVSGVDVEQDRMDEISAGSIPIISKGEISEKLDRIVRRLV